MGGRLPLIWTPAQNGPEAVVSQSVVEFESGCEMKTLYAVTLAPYSRKVVVGPREMSTMQTVSLREINWTGGGGLAKHVGSVDLCSVEAVSSMRGYDGRDQSLLDFAKDVLENSKTILERMMSKNRDVAGDIDED